MYWWCKYQESPKLHVWVLFSGYSVTPPSFMMKSIMSAMFLLLYLPDAFFYLCVFKVCGSFLWIFLCHTSAVPCIHEDSLWPWRVVSLHCGIPFTSHSLRTRQLYRPVFDHWENVKRVYRAFQDLLP